MPESNPPRPIPSLLGPGPAEPMPSAAAVPQLRVTLEEIATLSAQAWASDPEAQAEALLRINEAVLRLLSRC